MKDLTDKRRGNRFNILEGVPSHVFVNLAHTQPLYSLSTCVHTRGRCGPSSSHHVWQVGLDGQSLANQDNLHHSQHDVPVWVGSAHERFTPRTVWE